ncbi:probable ATP-dependent DNA helicase HFM1 [Uranotaenia lowii]|uniref:probable ATP-dependent DNA helicase HFM1 n=1 Tax=Uranotaenia lowii TaxID=190385 RepID=UPI002479682B|nr:probable ATP-dependent DNA helicase HFM1 [Uranotaenia lowii]
MLSEGEDVPATGRTRKWSSHPRPSIYSGRVADFRSVEEIAPVFRHIFNRFTRFNEIQSLVMDDMLYTDKSLVVSAPTGSGKTVIFELAMVRLLMKMEDEKYDGDFRMVYIAPIKALCAEKFSDWRDKFDKLGVKSAEVTGDSDFRDFWDLPDCNLILTTPEKWNSITRRWRQNVNFIRLIRLVLIDEVHILNDNFRGPILEAVVSRMRSIHRFIGTGDDPNGVEPMRIVALSATAPNVADLAAWVGRNGIKCFYNIAESRRPIKIEKHVLGYHCHPSTSSYRFDINLNYKLFDIISKYSGGRPSLVFCSTRKAVETASLHLIQNHSLKMTDDQRTSLQDICDKLQNVELKKRLVAGVGFHHAGLSIPDRNVIEDSFRTGQIPVLCCTSGLAMGVNLPAHLVVIKSTQMYTDYGMEEYPESSIFQMIGRAGRPQFDTFGVAVIMTQKDKVHKYQQLATGSVPIESFLHEHLAEHLNSEIVLQTITDLASAMDWIRSTFLYVRALSNPTRYGLKPGLDKTQIERHLEDLCRSELDALERYTLIQVTGVKDQGTAAAELSGNNQEQHVTFGSTVYGRLMAQYCLNFQTVKLLRKIKGSESLLEMFTILTHCDEFGAFKCRNSDKRCLNELNRSQSKPTVRFPLRGRIQTSPAMVSCLIQAVLGNLEIEDPSLKQEANRMISLGRRLLKCITEFITVGSNDVPDGGGFGEEEPAGFFAALLSTVILGQCLETKLWEDSPFISKQLRGIGVVLAGQLAARGKINFQELRDSDPRELEVIVKKQPPFGSDLIDFVRKLPVFSLKLELDNDYQIKLTASQTNLCYNREAVTRLTILVGDSKNNILFFNDSCNGSFGGNNSFQTSFKIFDATVASITGHVICSNWVGLDCSTTIVINEDAFKALNESKDKPKGRKTNQRTKKITEFYPKEDPKDMNTTVDQQDDELLAAVDLDVESNPILVEDNCPIVIVEDSPKKISLESFRFTQKPKLPTNNHVHLETNGQPKMNVDVVIPNTETNRSNISNQILVDSEEIFEDEPEAPIIETVPKVDVTIIEPEQKRPKLEQSPIRNFFTHTLNTQNGIQLAPCIPMGSPRYDPSNRIEYFTKMHNEDPFILFGHPEDHPSQLERLRSKMRRVCLFGVFSEIPRNNDEHCLPLGTKNVLNEKVAPEKREDFCTSFENNNDDQLVEHSHHLESNRKELDLGIEEFLLSNTESSNPASNFFR